MGKVTVRVEAGPDGKVKYTILGHSGGSNCQNTDGEELLKKLSEQKVPGFGGSGEELDSGKTSEFYETKKTKVGPIPAKPVEESPEQEEESIEDKPQKQRDLSMGYGT